MSVWSGFIASWARFWFRLRLRLPPETPGALLCSPELSSALCKLLGGCEEPGPGLGFGLGFGLGLPAGGFSLIPFSPSSPSFGEGACAGAGFGSFPSL